MAAIPTRLLPPLPIFPESVTSMSFIFNDEKGTLSIRGGEEDVVKTVFHNKPHRAWFPSGQSNVESLFTWWTNEAATKRIDVLHFAGHGEEDEGFVMKNGPLKVADLREMMKIWTPRVIFFNCCNSSHLVEELNEVPLRIGWEGTVKDEDAVKLARSFYDCLFSHASYDAAILKARAEVFPGEEDVAVHESRLCVKGWEVDKFTSLKLRLLEARIDQQKQQEYLPTMKEKDITLEAALLMNEERLCKEIGMSLGDAIIFKLTAQTKKKELKTETLPVTVLPPALPAPEIQRNFDFSRSLWQQCTVELSNYLEQSDVEKALRETWRSQLRRGELPISDRTTLLAHFNAYTAHRHRLVAMMLEKGLIPETIGRNVMMAMYEQLKKNS